MLESGSLNWLQLVQTLHLAPENPKHVKDNSIKLKSGVSGFVLWSCGFQCCFFRLCSSSVSDISKDPEVGESLWLAGGGGFSGKPKQIKDPSVLYGQWALPCRAAATSARLNCSPPQAPASCRWPRPPSSTGSTAGAPPSQCSRGPTWTKRCAYCCSRTGCRVKKDRRPKRLPD